MEDQPPEATPDRPANEKKKQSGKQLKIAMGVLLLVLVGLLIWFWLMCNKKERDLENKNKDLQGQVQDLRKELKEAKKKSQAANDGETNSEAACPAVSDDLKANIRDAVTSENYAALEGHMTNPITVVYAATEFGGPKTPAEAVSALDYLSNGTAPWDFNLPPATITGYADGDYAQYFPDGAYVGRASDSLVVSFAFECDQINQIFISIQEEIL